MTHDLFAGAKTYLSDPYSKLRAADADYWIKQMKIISESVCAPQDLKLEASELIGKLEVVRQDRTKPKGEPW